MSGALALASSLAAMDRDELMSLVAARRVLSPASVHDPLGLAIELLRPDSITRALQSAHRDALDGLRTLSEQHKTLSGEAPSDETPSYEALNGEASRKLIASGLAGLDTRTGRAVALDEVLDVLSGFEVDTANVRANRQASQADTSGWYGPALTSVRQAAHLLRTMQRRSVRLGRKGKLPAIALRELAETVHSDADTTDRLITIMRHAQLLVAVPWHDGAEHLVAAESAPAWLAQGYPKRWIILASAAVAQFDSRLRHGLETSGDDLASVIRHIPIDFPLLPEAERATLTAVAHTAEDLGLTVEGRLTAAALALLSGDEATATEFAHSNIPAPVERVYLQPDLSLIVPGPLLPDDEAALSVITDTEHLGPAASLRVSSLTLHRAARAGVRPNQIRALLQRLSLTGIPQPLDYLLTDLELKLDHSPENQTEIELPVPTAAPTSPAAATRVTVPSDRRDELAAMVDRVYAAAQEDDGDADMLRRLELAIRDRSAVRVTAVAGTAERIFMLLPVSLRGGRLRATDQQAGVERTLPVSAITAVESA